MSIFVIYSLSLNDSYMVIIALMFILLIILIISLLILFIVKLINVYTRLSNDDELISAITKTTILTLASVSFTFIVPIAIIFVNTIQNETVSVLIGSIVSSLDMFTNFLCVMLSFNYFDNLYLMICGRMHNLCKLCWYRIVGNTDDVINKTHQHVIDSQCSAKTSNEGTLDLEITNI